MLLGLRERYSVEIILKENNMADKKQVVLMVKGGVVELVSKPKNLHIILYDYDIDGAEGNIKTNKYGNYKEMELERYENNSAQISNSR